MSVVLRGGVSGLVAALAMTLVILVLRITLGFATPSELVGDRLTAFISIEQFFSLLAQFGGYNGLKQAGGGGVVVGQLVVGTLAGVVFGLLVDRRRVRGPLVAGVIVGVLWLLSVALLWPTLDTNYLGLPPDFARLTTAFGLLVSYSAYGLILALGYSFVRGRAPRETSLTSTSRRALLVAGIGGVFGLGSAALLGELFRRATFSYDGTEYRGADVQPITPNDRFYSVTKNIVDPSPTPAVWRLEIAGLVDRPRTYTYAELTNLPPASQETTLMCISNYLGGGLISNARWSGLAMRDLLMAAGPKSLATEVILYGTDGYHVGYTLEKALEPSTFVAYSMNDQPLPVRHGYPARVITPGLFGLNSVKWVTRIELVDKHIKGFYEQQGWGPSFAIPIRSTFFVGDFATPLAPAGSIPIRGNAFAGNRGVASVDVSADGGQTWQPARLDYPGTPLTWAFWTFDWQPKSPGDYTLVARATDRQGGIQTNQYRDTQPQGATGFPSLHVHVTA
jgi:DMSO/TMAO reductase YedYZ molybdopterin-dependent catalytic subunit